jgi:REP element-mobilizing transposase RayT
MTRTIGYHCVKSAYGMWLPGDDRGSWSEAWDEEIGFCEPHKLHPGDPVRLRMAEERMQHSPVWLTDEMMRLVMDTIGNCVERSAGSLSIAAAAIEPTHIHLLIPYSGRDIDHTLKWIADQTTKAVHRATDHHTPLWCKGRWRSFIYEPSYWFDAARYIERHNVRQGNVPRPWSFLVPAATGIERWTEDASRA